MAKKEITICDVCGDEVQERVYMMDEDFSVHIGDFDVVVFADIIEKDLCAPCMVTLYEKLFKKPVISAIQFDMLKQEREFEKLNKENNRRKKVLLELEDDEEK